MELMVALRLEKFEVLAVNLLACDIYYDLGGQLHLPAWRHGRRGRGSMFASSVCTSAMAPALSSASSSSIYMACASVAGMCKHDIATRLAVSRLASSFETVGRPKDVLTSC